MPDAECRGSKDGLNVQSAVEWTGRIGNGAQSERMKYVGKDDQGHEFVINTSLTVDRIHLICPKCKAHLNCFRR